MRSTADHMTLRRCVLAVSVLADVDVVPSDDGVVLPGPPTVTVGWEEIAAAAGREPTGDVARVRVEELLRLHAVVAGLGAGAAERLRSAARVVALPPGHADHLGISWVREHLMGGALQLGIGVHGLLGDAKDSRDGADRVVPLHPGVPLAAGVEATRWWPHLRRHVDRMGALAAARLGRDGTAEGVIRPVGGCDVLALLASPSLRRHLATGDGSGLRAVAVPMRRRGWYDLSRIDPAFVGAAWSATDPLDRGVSRPLLVTADEVAVSRGQS
jgi:hypothetical protein